MAVLIEALSVVIRANSLLKAFDNDWEAFVAIVPNQTLCADTEIVRVGFMTPDDVESFIKKLEKNGLVFLTDDQSVDIAVVDQLRGVTNDCNWLEFSHVNLSEQKHRVAACRVVNSEVQEIITPDGWDYNNSLSSSYGSVPTEHAGKGLKYLRHENGLDVYLNPITGEEVYVGRTGES